MQIKIIEPCAVEGIHREVGDLLTVGTDLGTHLINIHRAVLNKATTETGTIQTREPEVENRDPKPAKKAK